MKVSLLLILTLCVVVQITYCAYTSPYDFVDTRGRWGVAFNGSYPSCEFFLIDPNGQGAEFNNNTDDSGNYYLYDDRAAPANRLSQTFQIQLLRIYEVNGTQGGLVATAQNNSNNNSTNSTNNYNNGNILWSARTFPASVETTTNTLSGNGGFNRQRAVNFVYNFFLKGSISINYLLTENVTSATGEFIDDYSNYYPLGDTDRRIQMSIQVLDWFFASPDSRLGFEMLLLVNNSNNASNPGLDPLVPYNYSSPSLTSRASRSLLAASQTSRPSLFPSPSSAASFSPISPSNSRSTTNSATNSRSVSLTGTPSTTSTMSLSNTATATSTATATATATATVSLTNTATATSTSTATATASESTAATISGSTTSTATASESAAVSVTISTTSTATASESALSTVTISTTSTATASESAVAATISTTSTSTASASISAVAIASASESESGVVSASESESALLLPPSASASESESGVVSASASASESESGAVPSTRKRQENPPVSTPTITRAPPSSAPPSALPTNTLVGTISNTPELNSTHLFNNGTTTTTSAPIGPTSSFLSLGYYYLFSNSYPLNDTGSAVYANYPSSVQTLDGNNFQNIPNENLTSVVIDTFPVAAGNGSDHFNYVNLILPRFAKSTSYGPARFSLGIPNAYLYGIPHYSSIGTGGKVAIAVTLGVAGILACCALILFVLLILLGAKVVEAIRRRRHRDERTSAYRSRDDMADDGFTSAGKV